MKHVNKEIIYNINKYNMTIRERKESIRPVIIALMVENWPGVMSWKNAKIWANRLGEPAMKEFVAKYEVPVQVDPTNGRRQILTWDLVAAIVLQQEDNAGVKTDMEAISKK